MFLTFVIPALIAALLGSGEAPARHDTALHRPAPRAHCFPSPHLCGYPDPTDTGPSGPLTASGPIVASSAGATISGKEVTGTINVVANNVTIEDDRVVNDTSCGTTNACGNYAIRIAEGVSGTIIRDVETSTLPGDTCQQDIRNTSSAGVTIEGAYLHACDGNVYTVGPTVLKDSYGIAKIEISEDHIENVYMNETTFTAIHDTLFNPVGQTAVIFGNSGGGYETVNCSNHINVYESLLAGGGYSLYPCAHAAQPGSSSIDIEGTHFARCRTAETFIPEGGHHVCAGGPDASGYYPHSGSYGIATNYFPGVGTWRGNVWDDNLAKVCIDGSSNCE